MVGDKKVFMARHGDLLLVPIDKIPDKAKKFSSGTFNKLALGETTGHAHVLKTVVDTEVFELNGDKYFRIDEPATLSHEEHKTITIEPLTYKVMTEREFDYFSKEINTVRD